MVSIAGGLPHTQLCWGLWVLASHRASSRQGEAAGLAGLPAGEEQAQYHHGVIPIPAAGDPTCQRGVPKGVADVGVGPWHRDQGEECSGQGCSGAVPEAPKLLNTLNPSHVPGGLPWPGALHLCGPHSRTNDGTITQCDREVQLRAGQGSPGRLHQEKGIVHGVGV